MSTKKYEKPMVFISYRNSDTNGEANRLNTELDRLFGEGFAFLDDDKHDLKSGNKWKEKLIEVTKEAKIILVIIGLNWKVEELADEEDWVRKEIEVAIKYNKIIIPILIDDASIPNIDEIRNKWYYRILPQIIKFGLFRNKIIRDRILTILKEYQHEEIRNKYWNEDFKRLMDRIKEITKESTLKEKEEELKEEIRKEEMRKEEIRKEEMRKEEMRKRLVFGIFLLIIFFFISIKIYFS